MWLLIIKDITCTLREKISDFRYEFQIQTQLNWWFKVQKRLSRGQYFEAVLYRGVQCLTLCNPMICSTPGLPVDHQLPESTQTHVHWVDDAIQPSPSPPALNLSQHQGLFKWVSSSHQVAKVLEFQLRHHPGLISFPPKVGRASNLC